VKGLPRRTVALAAAVGALVLLLGCTACGIGAEKRATPLRSTSEAPTVGASATASAPSSRAFVVWMESDDELSRVLRRLPSPPTPPAVLDAVAAGPTVREQRRGLRTALVVPEAGPLLVAGAAPAAGAPVHVTVDEQFQELPANEQLLAVGRWCSRWTPRASARSRS
jgi:hypothetical protein